MNPQLQIYRTKSKQNKQQPRKIRISCEGRALWINSSQDDEKTNFNLKRGYHPEKTL